MTRIEAVKKLKELGFKEEIVYKYLSRNFDSDIDRVIYRKTFYIDDSHDFSLEFSFLEKDKENVYIFLYFVDCSCEGDDTIIYDEERSSIGDVDEAIKKALKTSYDVIEKSALKLAELMMMGV